MSRQEAQEVQKLYTVALDFTAEAIRGSMVYLDALADVEEMPQDAQESAFFVLVDRIHADAKKAAESAGEQMAFDLPGTDQRVNPRAADFDAELYRRTVKDAEGWPTFRADLLEALQKTIHINGEKVAAAGAAAAAKIGPGFDAFQNLVKQAQNVARRYAKLIAEASEAMQEIRPSIEAMARDSWPEYSEAPEEVQAIAFGLAILFAKADADGLDREGLTVAEVMKSAFSEEWEPIQNSPYFDLIERAGDYSRALLSAEEIEQIKKALQEEEKTALIKAGQLTFDGLKYPLDKVTDKIFMSEFEGGELAGKVDKLGRSVPAAKVFISIDEELEKAFDVPLTYQQKLVLCAWYSMQLAGAETASIDDIIKWTGKQNINQRDREAFKKDIEHLARTHFRIEQEGFGGKKNKRERLAMGGTLLAFTYIESDKRGAAGGGLQYAFFKPPKGEEGGPLLTFAERLGQVTYYPAAVLQTPSSKNEKTYKREDYFRARIAHFLNKTGAEQMDNINRKISFSTYFEKFGITDKQARKRERQYILSVLDYWTEINWIGGYTVERGGVLLNPPRPGGMKQIPAPTKKKGDPKK